MPCSTSSSVFFDLRVVLDLTTLRVSERLMDIVMALNHKGYRRIEGGTSILRMADIKRGVDRFSNCLKLDFDDDVEIAPTILLMYGHESGKDS